MVSFQRFLLTKGAKKICKTLLQIQIRWNFDMHGLTVLTFEGAGSPEGAKWEETGRAYKLCRNLHFHITSSVGVKREWFGQSSNRDQWYKLCVYVYACFVSNPWRAFFPSSATLYYEIMYNHDN